MDLKTQLIDGVGTVVGGPPDGGRPGERGDGREGHGGGERHGCGRHRQHDGRRVGRAAVARGSEPPVRGVAMTTGSMVRPGTGVSVRTGAGASTVTGTAAAAEVVTEQQKSRDSRANTQPSEVGTRERHRCRSVRALTLVMARHRSSCMKIQRIWVTDSAG
ncbi:hypothetical protein Smic_71130 [Streptomyces microflavus]|uniref:Uncharacterized protein n=1 Tax=Streptomyces microflavus TaxID=1919 RepID=A0A7J0D3A0_STRMI|nr:hypothetical protein Smic_71130 [Streptomyces microflavus]